MSEKLCVLIVDDDRRLAQTLVDIVRAKGFAAEAAYSGAEALEALAAGRLPGGRAFDCVLTDVKMPEMNGVELHHAIRLADPGLPVVLMTAYAGNALIDEALESGAIASLTKPLDINALLAFFGALRRECVIAIIDDDPAFRQTMGDILRARGFAVVEVDDPLGWEESVEPEGQIVLLDMKLNGLNGLELLKQMREKHPLLPVILVTGHRREMAAAIEAALEINAYACLYKPLEIERLLELLGEVRRRQLGGILGQPLGKGN